MVNSIGETIAGVGTEPKLLAGILATSTITVMPPPGHTYTGAPPQVTLTSRLLIDRVWRTGLSVTPARRLPPAPATYSTEQSDGSQFSPIRSTTRRTSAGISAGLGTSASSRTNQAESSPVVETISRRSPGRAPCFPSHDSTIESGSVMSVPPQPEPGLATWK